MFIHCQTNKPTLPNQYMFLFFIKPSCPEAWKKNHTGVVSAQKSYSNRSVTTPGEVSRSCMVCCFISLSLSSINRAYADKRELYLVKLLKLTLQMGALPVRAFLFFGVTASTLHLLLKWKSKISMKNKPKFLV